MTARTNSRKSSKNSAPVIDSVVSVAPEAISEVLIAPAAEAPIELTVEFELTGQVPSAAPDAPAAESSAEPSDAPAVSSLVPLSGQLTEAEIAAQSGETPEETAPKAKRAPRFQVQFIDSNSPDQIEIDSEHNSAKQAIEALKALAAYSVKRIKNVFIGSETENEIKLVMRLNDLTADYATLRIFDTKSQSAASQSAVTPITRLASYDVRLSLYGQEAAVIATVKSYYNGKDENGKRIPNGAEGTIDTLAKKLAEANGWVTKGYSHAGFTFYACIDGAVQEVGWMRICGADGKLTEAGQKRVDIIEKNGTTKHRAGKSARQALADAFEDFTAAPLAADTHKTLLALIEAYAISAALARTQPTAENAMPEESPAADANAAPDAPVVESQEAALPVAA